MGVGLVSCCYKEDTPKIEQFVEEAAKLEEVDQDKKETNCDIQEVVEMEVLVKEAEAQANYNSSPGGNIIVKRVSSPKVKLEVLYF